MEAADYEKAVANSQNMERLTHDLEEEKLMALLCSRATITVVEKAATEPDSTSKE